MEDKAIREVIPKTIEGFIDYAIKKVPEGDHLIWNLIEYKKKVPKVLKSEEIGLYWDGLFMIFFRSLYGSRQKWQLDLIASVGHIWDHAKILKHIP